MWVGKGRGHEESEVFVVWDVFVSQRDDELPGFFTGLFQEEWLEDGVDVDT